MAVELTFSGHFDISPEISQLHAIFIGRYCSQRQVLRDTSKIKPSIYNNMAQMPIGEHGEFFVSETMDHRRNEDDDSIIDINELPLGVPSHYCCWTISYSKLVWNENMKAGNFREWLQYLIDNFFKPWGYELNGEVEFFYRFEEGNDGVICVTNNVISEKPQLRTLMIMSIIEDSAVHEISKRRQKNGT